MVQSQERTASAVPLPGATLGRRRGDRGKVSMNLDVGQMAPQPPNPCSGNQLTVVKLYALKVVARDKVVQGDIGD